MGKTLAFRFYSFNCRAPYEHLSAANIEIAKLEAEVFSKFSNKIFQALVVPLQVKEIQSQAVLFEVNVPDFPLITKCRNENKMLKMLWDYIFLVRWGAK